jgi:small multidrug resistance pump
VPVSHWLWLSLAIALEVTGTLFLTRTDGFTRLLPSAVVVVSYCGAFYFLALTLRTMPVGIAYAVWAGVGVGLIALLGWLLLGQSLNAATLAGIGLIVAGVAVINLFSAQV